LSNQRQASASRAAIAEISHQASLSKRRQQSQASQREAPQQVVLAITALIHSISHHHKTIDSIGFDAL
jgi:hypothetical protein